MFLQNEDANQSIMLSAWPGCKELHTWPKQDSSISLEWRLTGFEHQLVSCASFILLNCHIPHPEVSLCAAHGSDILIPDLVARRIFTQNMKVCKTFHCITSRLIFVLLKAHPKESDSLRTSRTLQAELSLFFLLFWSQGGIVGIPTQREEFVAYFLGDMAQWGKCREYCSHLAFIQSKNAADGNIYGL